MKRVSRLLATCLFTLGISSSLYAQDIYEQYYGSGVHAYFAGNYQRAEELFNELIEAGSQDPRVHYFRGLTMMQSQGSMVEIGMPDFEQAAQLEVTSKRSADVAKALSRIQGPTRIAIERLRAKARFAAKSLQADAMQMSDAARLNNGMSPAAPNATPKANDPFVGDTGLTGGDPKPMPTPSDTPAAPASPFENPPAPNATEPSMPAPDTSNPFGEETKPAPAMPAPSDNPFGI